MCGIIYYMKKPTCTFPDYKFRRVTRNEDVNLGDKFNYRNPIIPSADSWDTIERTGDWNDDRTSYRKGFIIIRPL